MATRFTLRLGAFGLSACALLAACIPAPAVSVVHVDGKAGVDAERAGDPVKVRRPGTDPYVNVHGGAYVVRTPADWERLWKGTGELPPVPEGIDLAKEMLFVVATDDAIVSKLEIRAAVETGEHLTVVVRQTLLGEGCVRRGEEQRSGLDAIVAARIDKPVRFVIEDEDAPSCGEPPKTEIACRMGDAAAPSAKLTAKAGDVVECELMSTAKGKYELIDQVLSLVDAPPSSNAKLVFSKGAVRAKLTPDVFGTYTVRAESTDEAGRKGRANAMIEVLPKKTKDVLLQLTWSDADAVDPLAPLPRVLLRVSQEGAKGQRCSSEVPVPGLCDAKSRGSYTYMKIPASRRRLPLSLLYLDERAQDGAAPCVNVWLNGEKTASSCDHDHRHTDDRWELGTLETWTGKIVPPKPPPAPKADPKADPKAAPKPDLKAPKTDAKKT